MSDSEPESSIPAPRTRKSQSISCINNSSITAHHPIPRAPPLPANTRSQPINPRNRTSLVIESDGDEDEDEEDSDMMDDSIDDDGEDETLVDEFDEDPADGYQGISALGDQSRIQGYMNQFDPTAQKPRRGRADVSIGDNPQQSSSSSFQQPQSRARSFGRGRGKGRRSRFKGRKGKRVKSMALPK